MAVTQNEYTGNGSATTYSFTFPYLQTTDVKVKLDGVTQATTAYTFPTATTVQMNSAPGNNVKVLIYRDTGNDNKKATFYPGSAIKAEDLNDDFDQILYTAQEIDNYAMTTLGDDTMIGNLQMGENQLVFEGATADAHETSIGVVDPTADRTINFPNVSGNVVTTGDTGTVTATMLANVSVNTTELVDSAITTDKINTAAVTTAKIAADAVTGAKIADDQINSEHYVAGSIDTEHIADSQITTAKVAASAITTNQLADDAVTAAKLASNSVVSASIVDGAIVTGDIADNAVTTAKINADAITGAKIADDQINSEHYIDGSIDTAHLADDAVTTAKIAANAVTTSKLADAELNTLAGMQSGTASILAGGTALTATLAEINAVVDGKTVQTTISDTDASYPTSGAVVDYVAAQIAPLGGLEVIGDEDSFPSQPASGVVISIADAGGIVVNGSGVSTTARTSGNGSDNVTINGFPSTLYNTTLTDNMGLLVSSTGSSNTYTYHKLLGKESDIKTLSDDINDFNARYRIASSAPSSNNDDGDLYFDTTAKKMKVYNASTSQWDDVAQSSSSHIVTLSESFNGSLTDFTMSTAATDAQSTIVSINGVIQKPNAGTSTPAEGFAISGNTLKLSNAPATGSTYFVVVLGDTVSIGTPSDNTVATAKIQNLAVTTDKIAADAVTAAKIADDAVGAEHIEVLDANLQLADSVKIQVGTGNDLELFHDGTTSIIKNTNGNLHIRSDGNITFQDSAAAETFANFVDNGACMLYHDNIQKFETTSAGVLVTNGTSPATLKVQGGEGNAAILQLSADDGDDWNDHTRFTGSQGEAYIELFNNSTYEKSAQFIHGDAVYLFFNDSKKFETYASGVKATGNILTTTGDISCASDSQKITAGAGDDLQIYHNGSHSYLDNNTGSLIIRTNVAADVGGDIFIKPHDDENGINIIHDGAVQLYYANSKKFETITSGVRVSSGDLELLDNTGSTGRLLLGNGADLQLYHDGSHSYIKDAGTGYLIIKSSEAQIQSSAGEDMAKFVENGGVELYYDNTKRFETTSYGNSVHGHFDIATDGDKLRMGGSYDLEIQHSGSHAYIKSITGNVAIESVANVNLKVATNELGVNAIANGAVELHYDGVKKLETTSVGVGINDDSTGFAEKLQVTADYGTNNEFAIAAKIGSTAGTLMRFATTNSGSFELCGSITGSGTSTSFNTSSDYRLKENEVAISDGITRLKLLKPYRFNWKAETSKTVDGFFAHEVTPAVPEAITGEKDATIDEKGEGYQKIDYGKLVPLLTAALQEAITKIETLETKVAALEAK